MIVYRVTRFTGEGWEIEWFARLPEARKEFKPVTSGQLDRVDVPISKEGIVAALNMATMNPVNWPGERVDRALGTRVD